MALTQQHRLIAVTTPLGDDELVIRRMLGYEKLSQLFEYNLELYSEDLDINYEDLLGGNATVRVELESGDTRYFNGYISQFSCLGQDREHFTYQAILKPWLWFLTRTADCRIFQEMTVPNIIKQVFREHGFTDFKDELSGSYRTWEYCVQYRETDFNFVSRLMEQEGIYYFFTHENGKHDLVLADGLSSHQATTDYEEVPFFPPDNSGRRQRDHISHWRMTKAVQSGSYTLNDFDFKAPKKGLIGVSSQQRNHEGSSFEVYDYPGEYTESSEGESYARVRIDELQTQYEILKGEGDVRGLSTGALFSLTDYPREDQNREYLLLSVDYEINSDVLEGGGGGDEDIFHCHFSAIDSQQQYRAPRVTPKPIVQGLQTAIVVGAKGEEIHTDKYGRIKVHFHWDRYGKADDTDSCWIRVAQIWAGKKWGGMYIPRVGQEVIVDFIEGDPDRPIVTGRVYNGDNMPPYDLPAKKTMSTMKSNSSKGGQGFNEIRFEDKKDKEQFFIHAQKRMDQRVRGSLYETTYGNREVRVGWEKDGKTGGDYNTYVNKDINYHIKGSEYQLIDKVLHQTVVEDVVIQHKKNQTTYVTKDSGLDAKNIIMNASSQISLKSSKLTFEGTQGIHLKGGTVNIEGQQGISLKCGGNFISITPMGIDIKGTLVKINSGGMAKSAEKALTPAALDIEEPLDALAAINEISGTISKTSAKPRTHKKTTLTPSKVKPYKPVVLPPSSSPSTPPPAPKKDVKPAPASVSEKKCGIKSLTITDPEHAGARRPNAAQTLQIVPGGGSTTKYSEEWLGMVSVEITKSTGGSDDITASVTLVDESSGGRKQVALKSGQTAPSGADWVAAGKKLKVSAPSNTEIWPINAKPVIHYVYGRGCDNVKQQAKLEVYPSQQYGVAIGLQLFTELLEELNKSLKNLNKVAFGFVDIKPELIGPKGEMSASWGWKEDDDWQAYFYVETAIKLNPILGLKLTFSVSAVALTGAALGIPPVIGKVVGEHIADIIIAISVGISGGAEIGPTARFYASGHEKIAGQRKLNISGTFGGGITARLGSDWVISVAVTGDGEAKITGGMVATLKREGLFLEPEVELEPLTLSLTFVLVAVKKKLKENKSSWVPFDKVKLYPPAGQSGKVWKLYPK